MKDGFAMDCGHQLDIRYSFHTKISDDLKILRKRGSERERGRWISRWEYEDGEAIAGFRGMRIFQEAME